MRLLVAHFTPRFACVLAAVLVFGCGSNEGGTDAEATDTQADSADDDADEQDASEVVQDTFKWTGKCAGGPTMCDDSNLCTADSCDPHTGCTNAVKDCSDDDACTVDKCDVSNGECRHDPETCDDHNICTVNICDATQGCIVQSVLDCNDDDACTSDGCSPTKGCNNDAVICDDNKTCTIDTCDPKVGCAHAEPGGGAKCCETAASCEDDSPCTTHTCDKGICQTESVLGCCKTDDDCDDDNACTTDTCAKSNGACSFTYKPGAGCCAVDGDCGDGDECTIDRCVSGQCGHDVTCCAAAKDCEKGGALGLCAAATCTLGTCGATAVAGTGCCEPTTWETGFETKDTPKIKLLHATWGAWQLDPTGNLGKNTAGALVYRGASKQLTGGNGRASAVFDWIELPLARVSRLRFALFMTQGPQSPKEYLRVRIRAGVGEWQVFQYYGTGAGWQELEIDLTGFGGRAATRKIKVIFEVQPANSAQPQALIRIDDMNITSTCAARTCSTDKQCDDKLAATTETCVAGTCMYGPQPEYCETSTTCNDADFCTQDSCSDNVCAHTAIANCCHNVDECDDKNVCTTDTCTGQRCKAVLKPTSECCTEAKECDDKNPCTIDMCPAVGLPCAYTATSADCCARDCDCDDGDACSIDTCSAANTCAHQNQCCKVDGDCDDQDDACTTDKCVIDAKLGGMCAWTRAKTPVCCDKQTYDTDFDCDAGGFTFDNSLTTSKWQVSNKGLAQSGVSALHYGNLAKGNFDDGVSKGTATSGELAIAVGEKTTLRFALYMDSESGTTFDRLEVYALLASGAKHKVWDKAAKGFKIREWVVYAVDLSAFGGQTVRLQWLFDTNDGVSNAGKGVFVDDISVERSCADHTCKTAKDCDDLHAFSKETCKADRCEFTL